MNDIFNENVSLKTETPAFAKHVLPAVPSSEVYLEDCVKALKRFNDNHFDLAIVDPPYGIGFGEFNRTNKASNGERYKANKYKNSNWDDDIPSDEYFAELMRVSKIKLFGEVTTFLTYGKTDANVLFIGIKETQFQTLQMVNWLGLHLTRWQNNLILDITETYKAKQVQRIKYTLRKNQLLYMIGFCKTMLKLG